MNIFKDFLDTEQIKKPPTLVVVPKGKNLNDFIVDIRYTDFTGALDIPKGYPKAECYIVPPYKPLLYVGFQSDKDIKVDIYALRGN